MRVAGEIGLLVGIGLLFHVVFGWLGWILVGCVLVMLLIDKLFSLPGAARRRRRLEAGHCAECDYDLTYNTGERCPECGAKCESRRVMPKDE